MAKTLQLNFSTVDNKKVMLTVDEPRADFTEQEVIATMQTIIDSGVFEIEDYPLESVVGARIVERTVTDLIVG